MISRRAFLSVIAAGSLPLGAEAQQGKVYRIGVLAVDPAPAISGLNQGMADLGYEEGRNVRYEYRWAQGHDERLSALAADLVRMKVDAIVTWGTPAAVAAKGATSTIPIVLGAIGDPVVVGLVPNLARPGGNVTGFMTLSAVLEAKRLELLKELVPPISRIIAIGNLKNPGVRPALPYAQSAADALAVKLEISEAHDAASLARVLNGMSRQRPDAMLIMADPFLMTQSKRLAEFAAGHRLPSVANYREYPEAGGLLSYGPSYQDLFRRAAAYIDKILKGAKPGDLPIQQPTKFEFILNLKTAKALGLTIPPSVLVRADEVIQ